MDLIGVHGHRKKIIYRYQSYIVISVKVFDIIIHYLKSLINTNMWLDDSVKLIVYFQKIIDYI